jgi:hypothetical protein
VTCIVGVAHEGTVWIGGDSAGVAGYDLTVRSDVKVFRVGPYVLGFTDSFRMGQLLHYTLDAPTPPERDLERFMSTRFINAVRDCLTDGGFATNNAGQEAGGSFLVGARGRLFEVCSDYQVGEAREGYNALGCGANIALGALHLSGRQQMAPRNRVRLALEAAERHSAGVRGPFTIVNGGKAA